MKRLIAILMLSFTLTAIQTIPATAATTDDKIAKLEKLIKSIEKKNSQEIRALKRKVARLENENKDLKEKLNSGNISAPSPIQNITGGLKIGFSSTAIVHGVISGNNTGTSDKTDATWSADLSIEKEFENGGRAYALIETSQGDGLDSDAIQTLSAMNQDAAGNSDLAITQLYYEHPLLNGNGTITIGKIDSSSYIDNNNLANDETSQFISHAFKNASTIEFPNNGLGIRGSYNLYENINVNVGIAEDDGDFEDIGNSLFSFAQLAYSINKEGMEGNYRIYVWYDTSYHTYIKDNTLNKKNNFGFGISADQAISETLRLFARLGWADPSVSKIEWAWSGGAQIKGSLWNRKNDHIGIAVGQNIPGAQLEKSGSTNHKEGQFEIYYNYQLFDYLHISPIFQVVWNPNGVKDESVGLSNDGIITLYGIRTQLDF